MRASSGPSAASARCGRSTRTTRPTRRAVAAGSPRRRCPAAGSRVDEGRARGSPGGRSPGAVVDLHGASPPDRRRGDGRPSADLCTRPVVGGACGRLGADRVRLPCRDAPSCAPRAHAPAAIATGRADRRCAPRGCSTSAPGAGLAHRQRHRGGHLRSPRPPRRCCPRRQRRELRGRASSSPGSRATLIPVPDGAEVLLSSAAPVDGTDLTEVSLNLRTAQAPTSCSRRSGRRSSRPASPRTSRPRPSPDWPRRPRSPEATAPSCSSSASSTVTTNGPSPSAGGFAYRTP